ncbi:MAG: IPT/TIG domain-containing protein [Prevotellaceae bacterium]|nr:IPT/TIG domain-containing protein [Prevotellaceae bacterium]
MKKVSTKAILVILACGLLTCHSCKDRTSTGTRAEYDPSKPVKLASFYPGEGGIATRIIIDGSNFGSDPNSVRVWYNNKKASVIGASGEKLYVVTPRQPGDTCVISVATGNDSAVFEQPFYYHTTISVTTVAGKKGTSEFKAGTLATAEFSQPYNIIADAEGNIFVSQRSPGMCFMLNEEKDYVRQLSTGYTACVPAMDITGKIVIFPDDCCDNYYLFDADLQWAGKRRTILHPTDEDLSAGVKDFKIAWKYSLATSEIDGLTYTYDWNTGTIVKFDPISRKGQYVTQFVEGNSSHGILMFHPVDKHILYIGLVQKAAIYTYNTLTGTFAHYAGTIGVRGWRDGRKEDCFMSDIGQIMFDDNLNLLFADAGNNCIRRITPEGIVSTIIGNPNKAGYQDGNPEDALFDNPRGICIDKNNNIYIADSRNNCIRKLVIE